VNIRKGGIKMIFLGDLKQVEGNKYKVGLIHYIPDLLEDTSDGILVEKLLEPIQQDGKVEVLYVNIDTKELFYEYEEIPKTKEDILKDEMEIQKKQIADLTFMIMQIQGGTN